MSSCSRLLVLEMFHLIKTQANHMLQLFVTMKGFEKTITIIKGLLSIFLDVLFALLRNPVALLFQFKKKQIRDEQKEDVYLFQSEVPLPRKNKMGIYFYYNKLLTFQSWSMIQ